MSKRQNFASRAYWDNYINSIIESINSDKDTIIDMLMYGKMAEAEIKMCLSVEKHPSYEIKVKKVTEKSPFGDIENE